MELLAGKADMVLGVLAMLGIVFFGGRDHLRAALLLTGGESL